MPFGLHHFGRLQLYGVAANALAVPLTSTLVMPAGMAAAALMPFGLENLALVPMGWGVEGILAVARWVAGWPGAALTVPPIPAWGLGLCAFGMLWLCLWGARWRLLGVPLIIFGLASGAWQRPPDILVSADARLIGLRAGQGLAVQKLAGASGTDAGELAAAATASRRRRCCRKRGGFLADGIACSAGACTLRPAPDAPTAVLLRGAPSADACSGAALVVSAEPVRGRCAAQVVDRFAVWRNGAHAIWLEPGGVRVLSDRAARGARPWVPSIPVPRGTPSQDPPATVE